MACEACLPGWNTSFFGCIDRSYTSCITVSPTGTRINFIFAFTQVPPDLSDNIFVHVLRLHVSMCELVRVLGKNPKGFQAAGYGIRVSEGVAWAGETHAAARYGNRLLRPRPVFGQRSVKTSERRSNIFGCGVVGKKRGKRGGGPEPGARGSDDAPPLAPIVPPSAETPNFVCHHGVYLYRQRGTIPAIPRHGFVYISTLIRNEKEIGRCRAWWEVCLDGFHEACNHSSVDSTGLPRL